MEGNLGQKFREIVQLYENIEIDSGRDPEVGTQCYASLRSLIVDLREHVISTGITCSEQYPVTFDYAMCLMTTCIMSMNHRFSVLYDNYLLGHRQ